MDYLDDLIFNGDLRRVSTDEVLKLFQDEVNAKLDPHSYSTLPHALAGLGTPYEQDSSTAISLGLALLHHVGVFSPVDDVRLATAVLMRGKIPGQHRREDVKMINYLRAALLGHIKLTPKNDEALNNFLAIMERNLSLDAYDDIFNAGKSLSTQLLEFQSHLWKVNGQLWEAVSSIYDGWPQSNQQHPDYIRGSEWGGFTHALIMAMDLLGHLLHGVQHFCTPHHSIYIHGTVYQNHPEKPFQQG